MTLIFQTAVIEGFCFSDLDLTTEPLSVGKSDFRSSESPVYFSALYRLSSCLELSTR